MAEVKRIWVYDLVGEGGSPDVLMSDHPDPVPPKGYRIVGLRCAPNFEFDSSSDDSWRFSLGDEDDRVLEAFVFDNKMSLGVENFWCGDTVTGLGAEASYDLTPSEARVLGEFLLRWADSRDA